MPSAPIATRTQVWQQYIFRASAPCAATDKNKKLEKDAEEAEKHAPRQKNESVLDEMDSIRLKMPQAFFQKKLLLTYFIAAIPKPSLVLLRHKKEYESVIGVSTESYKTIRAPFRRRALMKLLDELLLFIVDDSWNSK